VQHTSAPAVLFFVRSDHQPRHAPALRHPASFDNYGVEVSVGNGVGDAELAGDELTTTSFCRCSSDSEYSSLLITICGRAETPSKEATSHDERFVTTAADTRTQQPTDWLLSAPCTVTKPMTSRPWYCTQISTALAASLLSFASSERDGPRISSASARKHNVTESLYGSSSHAKVSS